VRLLNLQDFLLAFFLFSEGFVLADVVLKVRLVIFQFLFRVNQRLVSALLFLFQVFDLLPYSVGGELSQEHFLLLLNKLVDILHALFLGELDSATGDVHGFVNSVLLLEVEILLLGVVL